MEIMKNYPRQNVRTYDHSDILNMSHPPLLLSPIYNNIISEKFIQLFVSLLQLSVEIYREHKSVYGESGKV